jgi:protein SCO1
MYNKSCALTIAIVMASAWLTGCQHAQERRFDLQGKVISVDRDHKQVTLAHEEIKGFMPAMTMPFAVKDVWAMDVLAPGQEVEATLVVQKDHSWIEGLRVSKAESTQEPAAFAPFPKVGDEVPDFTLWNQDNKPIHLSQYRGKTLLLTFIYTRCPLPDFCPRTSQNFSEIHRDLQSLSLPAGKPHLLTVSFDTENDTPAVLREYARRYMNPVSFEDWEFASGTPEQIIKITSYFGLSFQRDSGQIVHSLVTALIGPDGKLLHLYLGNGWTPKLVLELIMKIAPVAAPR